MRFVRLALLALLIGGLGTVPTPVLAQDNATAKAPDGMVLVPAGPFTMGSDQEDHFDEHTIRTLSDANPRHSVDVRAFYLDKTEVANAQYKKYCDATRYPVPPHWKNGTFAAGEENLPVWNVNWWEAVAYSTWAGKRLPTETEWEKAARGTDGRIYPWGNEWDDSRTVNEPDRKHPNPVGSRPDGASPYGILDMAGNVMEWVHDWYQAYPGAPQAYPEFGTTHKVVRGGAYGSGEALFRTDYRCIAYPGSRSEWIGFRCAKNAP